MKRVFTSIFSIAFGFWAFGQGQSQVITEDFNGTTIPMDWSQTTQATDGGWRFGSNTAMSSQFFPIPSTGSNIAATNDDDCNCNKTADLLITKPVDLSNYSSVHVTFKMYYLHAAYQGNQENAAFLYSTNGGTTWTTVENITTGSADWQTKYFDVSGAAGNDSVWFGIRYGDGGGWNYGLAVDDFTVYIPYNYDFTTKSIDMYPVQGLNNAPFTIEGTIQNVGGQTVNSLDINYDVDGSGNLVTAQLTNLNLAPFATYSFSHPLTWNPSSTGNYDVEAWASNLDGTSDQNTSNDKFLLAVQVVPSTGQRQVLVEEFTSSTCPPCASFNAQFTPILNANAPNTANGKVNVVKYQMNWPSPGTDPNYNQDGDARKTYYGVSGVPNPFMDAVDGASSQNEIDQLYAVPSLVNLTGAWDYSGTTATVNVTVDPLANLSGNLRLRIAIVEEEIKVSDFPGYAVTNGETEFNYVLRKMLPNAAGINLGNLIAGTATNHTEAHTFTLGNVSQNTSNLWYTMDDLQVVAWIQDDTDKSILQSVTLPKGPIGIDEFGDVANDVKIYPNPALTQATAMLDLKNDANVSFTIVNNIGQVVLQENTEMFAGYNKTTFDVSNLAAGVYMLNINIDGVTATKRISITR